MLNTQCSYEYILAGIYPVIDTSTCTTTGTTDEIPAGVIGTLLTIQIIGISLIIFPLFFWILYKLSGGKR